MPSSTDQRFKAWNQKLHIYLGLYFLIFLWLFAGSGLLLNHGPMFAEFWSKRQQSTTERPIVIPPISNDLGRARELMRQLELAGEVEWTTTQTTADRFDF